MPQQRPTIVLVDDEPVTRSAIRRLLEEDGFEVCAETGAGESAIKIVAREHPQLCLVDPNTPRGGLRVVREVSRRVPSTVIVVLTGSENRGDLSDAIRAGASGYLLKNMNPDRLAPALRGVLAGEAAIPRFLVAELVRDLQTNGKQHVIAGRDGRAALTGREWEILGLMCDGLSGSRIAERLYLSPVTVRRHCAEIVRKLGVGSREEAITLVAGVA
jgi:DNA-binding NarL/FixJ family response regulator